MNFNFEYKIVDDFFDKDDLDLILSAITEEEKKQVADEEIKIYPNRVFKNDIKTSLFSETNLKYLNDKYHSKCIEILKILSPEKVNLYDYSEFDLNLTGKNYKFPIHSDTPNKLLSCVVYLEPLKNNGTFLYADKKGNGKIEIEWKKNRALFFSRKENDSWHSYEGNKDSLRIVLVYNLMTTKIKQVYKIENKSFYLGALKAKLNPYLYKYLNFTI